MNFFGSVLRVVLSALALCVVVACGSEEETQAPVDSTGYLNEAEQILAALPKDLRSQQDLDEIMQWHRDAFGEVVLKPIQQANGALETTDLLELIDFEKYKSTEEAKAAETAVREARGVILASSQEIESQLRLQKAKIAEQFDGREDVVRLVDRLPINYLAEHARGNLERQAEMTGHLANALELYAFRFGEGMSDAEKAEFKKQLELFQKKYAEWSEWVAMDPQAAVEAEQGGSGVSPLGGPRDSTDSQ